MQKNEELTVRVRRGVKVRVEEVDALRDDDSRIPTDRDVHVVGPEDLKIAIKTVSKSAEAGRASVVLRCG